MAETVFTPDGVLHAIVGSTTHVSLIQEYAGDDLANWAYELQEQLAEAQEKLAKRR